MMVSHPISHVDPGPSVFSPLFIRFNQNAYREGAVFSIERQRPDDLQQVLAKKTDQRGISLHEYLMRIRNAEKTRKTSVPVLNSLLTGRVKT